MVHYQKKSTTSLSHANPSPENRQRRSACFAEQTRRDFRKCEQQPECSAPTTTTTTTDLSIRRLLGRRLQTVCGAEAESGG